MKENTAAQENTEQPQSMEEILQTIRGVIAGDEQNEDDEVLELTEVVNDDGSTSTIDAASDDVLNNIDKIISENNFNPSINADTSNFDSIEVTANENQTEPETEAKIEEELVVIEEKINHELPANIDVLEQIKEDLKDKPKAKKNMAPKKEPAPKAKRRSLISDESATKSSSELQKLVKSVSKSAVDHMSMRNGTTLEDIVIEAIKPYLSSWLDENLPIMVKSIVEKEIRKLIPNEDE